MFLGFFGDLGRHFASNIALAFFFLCKKCEWSFLNRIGKRLDEDSYASDTPTLASRKDSIRLTKNKLIEVSRENRCRCVSISLT